MQLKRFVAVVRLNLLLQMKNPTNTLILTAVPFIVIPFMEPAFKSMLIADGYADVSGVEQAVPSMAVLFSFLAVQTVIQSFFHEHAWGTWPRLEMSATSPGALLAGKAAVAYFMQAL